MGGNKCWYRCWVCVGRRLCVCGCVGRYVQLRICEAGYQHGGDVDARVNRERAAFIILRFLARFIRLTWSSGSNFKFGFDVLLRLAPTKTFWGRSFGRCDIRRAALRHSKIRPDSPAKQSEIPIAWQVPDRMVCRAGEELTRDGPFRLANIDH